jgi:hypothetical protein
MKMRITGLVLATLAALAIPATATAQSKGKDKDKKGAKPPQAMRATGQTTTGTVLSYEPSSRVLTLNNGSYFQLSPSLGEPLYKTGDKVKVEWRLHNEKRIADHVMLSNLRAVTPVAAVAKPAEEPPTAEADAAATKPADAAKPADPKPGDAAGER